MTDPDWADKIIHDIYWLDGAGNSRPDPILVPDECAQALRDEREACAKIVCPLCYTSTPFGEIDPNHHLVNGSLIKCKAAVIRRTR